MTDVVFLLTVDKVNENIIIESVGSDYIVSLVNKSDIMIEIMKSSPIAIIVDLSGYDDQMIDYIKTVISVEYIPVIFLHDGMYDNYINDSYQMFLPIKKAPDCLEWMIKQAAILKYNYNKLLESHNAMNLISNTVNEILNSKNQFSDDGFLYLMNKIYAENQFISNIPEIIWRFRDSQEKYEAVQFKLCNNQYLEERKIYIDKTDKFKFDIEGENGFSKNYNAMELSDIGYNKAVFPNAMMPFITNLNNFDGYKIDKLIIMGINFKNNIKKEDVDITKAVTISYDMITTIKMQVKELEQSFNYTMDALARAAEANDDVTGQHIKRVNKFSKLLSQQIGMNEDFINKIENSAQMHDVGKIYVDRNIITKPGKLTEEEFELIKQHTIFGEKIIGNSENLKMACEIARNHHERYDGTGYPSKLKGEEIPISARIVCLADIYDALRSKRSYKQGFTHEEAYEIITKGDGRVMPYHFDPKVLEAFKKVHLKFDEVFNELVD